MDLVASELIGAGADSDGRRPSLACHYREGLC